MKKITITTLFAALMLFAFSFSSFAQKGSTDPIKYNNKVLNYYTELDNEIATLHKTIYDNDATVQDLKNQYNKVKEVYAENYPLLKKIKPLSEDKWYYKAVVDFYKTVKSTLDHEFKDIVGYYSKDWEDSYGPKIDALDQAAVDKIVAKEDAVISGQKKFADHFNISLTDDDDE